MTEALQRMLLSHNFNLSDQRVPILSRATFGTVFTKGLIDQPIQCCVIDNPHWIVEIRFDPAQFSPVQVGELCAHALLQKRKTQQSNAALLPKILILGGLKSTPAVSPSPQSLQIGEWGVDVVETINSEQFLQEINWIETVAQRSPNTIFKVEL